MTSSLKIAVLMLALRAAPAGAWGNQGHHAVGALAARLIAGTRAEREVRALLHDGETLEAISTWADCAKGHCGPLTPEMTEFARKNPRHGGFHYTDVPYSAPKYALGGPGTRPDDIVQTLSQCILVLQGKSANPHQWSRREALLLLVHLVGDLHQPLHVGTAYVDGLGSEGDNFLYLGNRSFHSYWDTQMVDSAFRHSSVSTPEAFADKAVSAHIHAGAGAATDWPRAWADEMLAAAAKAHDGVVIGARQESDRQDHFHKPHAAWPVSLPGGYAERNAPLASAMLVEAGQRLAALLVAIWPDSA